MMKSTKNGMALYLHCLPADISGVSCKEGEVAAAVFERYRIPLYKQAGHMTYIIAAMIFLAKIKRPQEAMDKLVSQNKKRHL
jgi:ornithine carbamoyltransferase